VTGKAAKVLEALGHLSQDEQLEVITRSLKKPSRIPRCDVDVTPFRERFLVLQARDELSATSTAKKLGWFYGDKRKNADGPAGDGTRLKRRLGLAAENGGSGYWTVRRHVSYETAVALCDALDIDYVDADV
jgi:hypothetical protein